MKLKRIVLGLCLLFTIGCGGGGSGNGGASSYVAAANGDLLITKSIGPNGATTTVAGTGTPFDGMTLSVPAGTLTTTVLVTISTVPNPMTTETINLAFGPEGLVFNTTNATPTLVVSYSDQFLADNEIDDPSNIRVASRSAVSGIIEPLTVLARDTTAKTITVALPHFSFLNIFGSATQPAGFGQVLTNSRTVTLSATLPESVKNERTLIIVHGICSSGQDMLLCTDGIDAAVERSDVLKAQYKQVYIFNYPWKKGIDGTADEANIENRPAEFLQRALAAVSSTTPTVDIVAHSMGGLVSRYALEQVDTDVKARKAVRNLVMIATPNDGSMDAALRAISCSLTSKTQAAEDLKGSGARLSTLRTSRFDNFLVRYVTIAGDLVNSGYDIFLPSLGIPVTNVELAEPGAPETRPLNYEHITFHGKPGAFFSGSPAGHSGLHCRAADASTIGAFQEITSNVSRTIDPDSNVATVLEAVLRDTPEIQPQWQQLTPAHAPDARYVFGMSFDSVRERAVLFGGRTPTDQFSGDTWEWDGADWQQRLRSGGPPGLVGCSLAYDPNSRQTLLFGGSGWGDVGQPTWLWDGTSWALQTPTATPPNQTGSAMTFDSARGVIFLFDSDASGRGSHGTWQWDGANWAQQNPSLSPSTRVNFALAYDSARQRAVLFGGLDTSTYLALNDTWEWDGSNWQQKHPATAPSVRLATAMVYDPSRKRTILFGGGALDSARTLQLSGDTWQWDGVNWKQLPVASAPSPRYAHGMVYDSARHAVLLYGGLVGDNPTTLSSETWTLSP